MSSAPEVVNSSNISSEVGIAAPGFETRENNSILGNGRGPDQEPNGQLPSYTDIRPGGNSEVNVTRMSGKTEYGSGPGFDDIAPKNTSEPGLGSQTTSYDKPPGISGQVRENQSKNNATNTTPAAPVNPQDCDGISYVGRKFKAVNPVKKNEN
ncbi:hypothetical protein CTI12_AA505500 [Artemisia annua]|uniref:Uncharacterized protein n=1 Tax=Artemisia annua TaxID=35608 RepID=A0A2U1LCP3_ARTAN|nr:hypothetical protein CTI12_AA505500 [Artemisia annua]